MNSIDNQGSNLGSRLTPPTINWTSGHSPCIVLSGGKQWQITEGEVSVSSPSSMGIASSHQGVERGVCVLTSCRSRKRGIQPSRPPTQNSLTAQSQQHFLIQMALLRANLKKSYHQTALLRANLRKSSETTFDILTTHSWQITWNDDAAVSTTCRPTLPQPSGFSLSTKHQH